MGICCYVATWPGSLSSTLKLAGRRRLSQQPRSLVIPAGGMVKAGGWPWCPVLLPYSKSGEPRPTSAKHMHPGVHTGEPVPGQLPLPWDQPMDRPNCINEGSW